MCNYVQPICHPAIVEWFRVNPFAGLLLILIAADILLGILRAIGERRLASDISSAGINRKATKIVMVLVGEALERFMPGLPASEFIAMFYCGSEGLSIVENAGLLGVPLPRIITDYFAKLGEDGAQGGHVPIEKRTQNARGIAENLTLIGGDNELRSK